MVTVSDEVDTGTHRPPCEAVAHMQPHAPNDDFNSDFGPELERRVCPNCRLYFDTGRDSDSVFCGQACRRRHERGVVF